MIILILLALCCIGLIVSGFMDDWDGEGKVFGGIIGLIVIGIVAFGVNGASNTTYVKGNKFEVSEIVSLKINPELSGQVLSFMCWSHKIDIDTETGHKTKTDSDCEYDVRLVNGEIREFEEFELVQQKPLVETMNESFDRIEKRVDKHYNDISDAIKENSFNPDRENPYAR